MMAKEKSQNAFNHLCSELGFIKKIGLITSENDTQDAHEKYIFEYARGKLNLDAIFFYNSNSGPSVPFIYFKKFETEDHQAIAELHKLVWNMGQAPLLFIILPTKVLIYNAYAPPKIERGNLDVYAGFIEEIRLFVTVDREIKKLSKYRSSELLTGNYWQKNSDKFDKKNRVNENLLNNLEFIRKKLNEEGLSNEIVHNLITRAIFIKYLEDRRDRFGNNVFPKDFFNDYNESAKGFVDLLSDRNLTYSFFHKLSEKFNGDIFFAEDELDQVKQSHLNLLQKLLRGEMYLESGQTTFWPLYSFDVIPIELISNIYQKFVHSDNNKIVGSKGTHYTPYHLAIFLMDQVLPWDETRTDIKILDPSCGSGIFLVESYRRLIHRWVKQHKNTRPSIQTLNKILKECIFGVDINEKAIRIAALSLYLTICDYLEPRDIWDNLTFQPLINNNLFSSDFFVIDGHFALEKYDIIIGNPPWESKVPDTASKYLKNEKKTIGDNQICQAFLWRVRDLCKPDGEICLLVSSKGLLFNRSSKNKQFRNQFFSITYIKSIINFSILRPVLYPEAVGPCAAIFFSPNNQKNEKIRYITPKPTYSPQDDWLFIIEPQDISEISKEESLDNDIIWKVAMWGTPRDYELIKRLLNYPNLGEICDKKGWVSGEGFTVGKTGKKPDFWLSGKPDVQTKKLEKFVMNVSKLPKLEETSFVRPRNSNRPIFLGPHLLIGQSPHRNKGITAALLKDDAVFRHTILGIHGNQEDINDLAACCLIVNSRISLYFEMLTSRNWMVERDNLEKEEFMDLPIPIIALKSSEISWNFLETLAAESNPHSIIDKFIKKWYDLSDSDLILINDTIDYTLDFFTKERKSIAIKSVSSKILEEYGKTYCKILNNSFSNVKKFQMEFIYEGDGPLKVISIRLVEPDEKFDNNFKKERIECDLKEILKKLDQSLIEEISQSIFIRRTLRRYSQKTITIVKPNQIRFWTRSSALRDADETYREIMSFNGGLS